jgi:hypothetical protein
MFILQHCTVEERLEGLSPELILGAMTPQQILNALTWKQFIDWLPPEQIFETLTGEQLVEWMWQEWQLRGVPLEKTIVRLTPKAREKARLYIDSLSPDPHPRA